MLIPVAGCQMAFEVHRGVEDPDDFQRLLTGPEEDHMPALRRDPASGKKIVPLAATRGIGPDGFKSLPQTVDIVFLLLLSPMFKGVGAD